MMANNPPIRVYKAGQEPFPKRHSAETFVCVRRNTTVQASDPLWNECCDELFEAVHEFYKDRYKLEIPSKQGILITITVKAYDSDSTLPIYITVPPDVYNRWLFNLREMRRRFMTSFDRFATDFRQLAIRSGQTIAPPLKTWDVFFFVEVYVRFPVDEHCIMAL